MLKEHSNISVLCTISAINIDERVGVEFKCDLVEKKESQTYILQVKVWRRSIFYFEDLVLGVDFMVAQDLRLGDYNMTTWQEHIANESIN